MRDRMLQVILFVQVLLCYGIVHKTIQVTKGGNQLMI